MTDIAARGITATFNPAGGLVRDLTVSDQGRRIAPLHVAPWVAAGEVLPPGLPPHLTGLAGDFFCAPFGGTADGSDLHGWPANGHWQVVQAGSTLRAVLDRPVSGAKLIKDIGVSDDHPFLYQRHIFIGGQGTTSVANHAMVSLPAGGHLRFSPKRWFQSAQTPPEPDRARGRSTLAYPHRSTDPHRFARADGGTADLTRYPFADRSEDFVMAVEEPGHDLGWTAVTRPAQGDLYLSLRHAQRLPMTMLWHSNGGRDYAPWNGRHLGCLGVEEGLAPQMLGPDVPSDLRPGLALSPDTTTEVRHVIGAIAWSSGAPVAQVALGPDTLTVTGEDGTVRTLPYRSDFLR